MGELAVRPVDLAPLVEQGEDLGFFSGQDAVGWAAARGLVGQSTAAAAGVPAMGTDLAEVERATGPADRPAGIHRFIDEVEQPCLGGRVDPAWDSATQPQPPFPSTNVNLTASTLQASESRAISALACSSS